MEVRGVCMESNTQKVQVSNTMALVGFVMSFFNCIVGLILSIIGMSQIKKTGEPGKGFALAGIIISSVSLVFTTIFLIIYFILIFGLMLSEL
jgi:hypothetical protein